MRCKVASFDNKKRPLIRRLYYFFVFFFFFLVIKTNGKSCQVSIKNCFLSNDPDYSGFQLKKCLHEMYARYTKFEKKMFLLYLLLLI